MTDQHVKCTVYILYLDDNVSEHWNFDEKAIFFLIYNPPFWPRESLRNCQDVFSSSCQMPCKMSGGMSYLIAYPQWTFAFLMPVIYIRCLRQLHNCRICASPATIFLQCEPLIFFMLWEGRQVCWTVPTEIVIDFVMCGICSLIYDTGCQIDRP